MDKTQPRALLEGERARLERLPAAEPRGLGAPDVGDEVDDAARREAGETDAAVDQLLWDRWAALERAEARSGWSRPAINSRC